MTLNNHMIIIINRTVHSFFNYLYIYIYILRQKLFSYCLLQSLDSVAMLPTKIRHQTQYNNKEIFISKH